jgi:thiol-disulfide isomerase/thioredoxin
MNRLRLLAPPLLATLLLGVFVATPVVAQDGWRLPGLDGGALTEADVASGATVLVVWAGWSPRCRDIVERINDIAARWGGKARVASVNFQETPEEARSFLAGKGLRAPVYLDREGSFAKRHRVSTLPGLVIFRNGEVAYAGKLPDDPASTIDDALD